MSEQNNGKLNQLLTELHDTTLVSSRWLRAHGFSSSLIARYVTSGWLVSPARGVYLRKGGRLQWKGVVHSLQTGEGLPLHVGGRFALAMQGHEHYLRLGEAGTITLYGPAKLPGWVSKLPLKERFEFLGEGPFNFAALCFVADMSEKTLLDQSLAWLDTSPGADAMVCSTPERAILELCDGVSNAALVYEADALMQAMTTLRPQRVGMLLRHCHSIKAKRLFLALADRHRHAWLPHVPLNDVDLGRGKRALVSGGRLHPFYQITLPGDLDEHLDKRYTDRVQLLVEILPVLAEEPRFALKGGTAINLFEHDLPRLSVDIDLAWLPVHDFAEDASLIAAALERLADVLRARPLQLQVQSSRSEGKGSVTRLVASRGRARVQIETTPVMRGTVHPVRSMVVRPKVEEAFGFASIQVLDFADLYAGKLAAALSRQHPRDLFDVGLLLEDERANDVLWRTFLVYMTCSPKPAWEMLAPGVPVDFAATFDAHFRGMTAEPVSAEQLLESRERLLVRVAGWLDEPSRAFLISVEDEKPDFGLIGFPYASALPGVRRKLHNLAERSSAKRQADRRELEQVLERIAGQVG